MIGVYTTEPMTELRGRVSRRVYHLMLRDLSAPIIVTDDTKNTLVKRVRHITGDGAYFDAMSFARTYKEDWWSIQKRVGFRPSQYYDQVADMVMEEFPALRPYVVIKRAGRPPLMIYDPAWDSAEDHRDLISERKKFKYEKWADTPIRDRP